MTEIDLIIGQVLGLTERVEGGIYMKRLDNGRLVFSCRCPCGTIHGGYRSYEEADQHRKCRMCYRSEIERTRKEVEKVDKPKKQKSIFQHRLNKPAVIGEADVDFGDEIDFLKDVLDIGGDRIAYQIWDGREHYPVSRDGLIGRQGYKMGNMTEQWKVLGMTFHHWSRRPVPWKELRMRLESGETLRGYLWDLDHGGVRTWGRPVQVYKISVNENDQEDQDILAVLAGRDTAAGEVNKMVCENTRPGQDLWHRFQKHVDGSPIRVQVSGKCLTWEDRPDEYRLPVKYGLFQTLYITEHNAGDYTTVRPAD